MWKRKTQRQILKSFEQLTAFQRKKTTSRASASRQAQRPKTKRRRAVEIIDGDSFVLGKEKIRIKGIDAPEIGGAECLAERLLGLRAKAFLAERLGATGAIDLVRYDQDQYGRTLATVYVGGADLAKEMIRLGLAVEYRGYKADWCK
ncbi:MAG: thermonuclease family protein [Pseudomonadota bacterium]